jgi:hypothetical protein
VHLALSTGPLDLVRRTDTGRPEPELVTETGWPVTLLVATAVLEGAFLRSLAVLQLEGAFLSGGVLYNVT